MKKAMGLSILALSVTAFCFAQSNQTESLTIATYYPSPYGVYRNLKLSPSNVAPSGPALSAGVMFYNNTSDSIMYYNKAGKWINLTESGAGEAIIGSEHTKGQCSSTNGITGFKGAPTDIGMGFPVCKFEGSDCPSGWHRYKNWTATTMCSVNTLQECNPACGGPFGHPAFSDVAPPSPNIVACTYKWIGATCYSCAMCPSLDPNFKTLYGSCAISVTQVGCY